MFKSFPTLRDRLRLAMAEFSVMKYWELHWNYCINNLLHIQLFGTESFYVIGNWLYFIFLVISMLCDEMQRSSSTSIKWCILQWIQFSVHQLNALLFNIFQSKHNQTQLILYNLMMFPCAMCTLFEFICICLNAAHQLWSFTIFIITCWQTKYKTILHWHRCVILFFEIQLWNSGWKKF